MPYSNILVGDIVKVIRTTPRIRLQTRLYIFPPNPIRGLNVERRQDDSRRYSSTIE
jgi:hypothetical protein